MRMAVVVQLLQEVGKVLNHDMVESSDKQSRPFKCALPATLVFA